MRTTPVNRISRAREGLAIGSFVPVTFAHILAPMLEKKPEALYSWARTVRWGVFRAAAVLNKGRVLKMKTGKDRLPIEIATARTIVRRTTQADLAQIETCPRTRGRLKVSQ